MLLLLLVTATCGCLVNHYQLSNKSIAVAVVVAAAVVVAVAVVLVNDYQTQVLMVIVYSVLSVTVPLRDC